MIGKQFQRTNEKIVKIQRIGMTKLLFVCAVQIVELLAAEIAGRFHKPFIRTKQAVLGVADFRANFARIHVLFINVQRLVQFLEYAGLIIVVVDGKGTAVAELFDIAAQNTGAHGVKGAHPYVVTAFANQLVHAFLHFFGGFVGKGDGQNMPRRNAMINQIGNAVGERACFAAACACQNQNRAFQRFGSFALLTVQTL